MTFTAAQLESALEAMIENDKIASWDEIGSMAVPNPEYDAALDEQLQRLRSDWRNLRYGHPHRDDAYKAYSDFVNETGNKGWATVSAPTVVEIDGQSYEVKVVDSYGGEGQGDALWVVLEVAGRLFRKDGYWVSYDGSYWDGDFREVRPVQKTVTEYVALDASLNPRDGYAFEGSF